MFFEYSAEIVLIVYADGGADLKHGHITVKQQFFCIFHTNVHNILFWAFSENFGKEVGKTAFA